MLSPVHERLIGDAVTPQAALEVAQAASVLSIRNWKMCANAMILLLENTLRG